MLDQLVSLSTHPHGCRVVQKALAVAPMERKRAILKEIEPHIMKCIQDQNGNHVVQKIIEQVRL
jgi:hypothetical protein